MARRDRFVRGVGGKRGRRGGHAERARRNTTVTAWLVMATLVCAFVVGLILDRKDGIAWASADETKGMDGRLAITVLRMRDLERDLLGRVSFEGWGTRPPRLVSVALRNEISVLREHRDRVRDQRWPDLRPRPFPNLPIADDVPPRMDRGGPDPDRLLPSSRPVTENAQ